MSWQGPRNRGSAGGPVNEEAWLVGGAVIVAVLAVGDIWAAAHLAARFNGGPTAPRDPFTLLTALAKGTYAWPAAATWWAVGVGAGLLTLLIVLAVVAYLRLGRGIDRAARNATRDRGIARYTAKPRSLAPGAHVGPGPVIGRTVPGARRLLRATWEDMVVVIAGPRTGKTTAYAIPVIMDAPGAVLVTSNKRDIVDATRALRETTGETIPGEAAPDGSRGARAWVFDPQGVAGAGPGWWWNPLSYVRDVRTARKLAAVWTNASREPGARIDAYFDAAGAELLAQMLLAAAAAGASVAQVFSWLADPDDDTAVKQLRQAGHARMAEGLRANVGLPDKQRAGVYASAAKTASFLSDPAVLEWVEDPDGARPQFSPAAFVASSDTLYSLSREGEGSSGPLVTALTMATLEAAEGAAARSTGGRLVTPLLAVLDEVANVCRWAELPDLYSHYGSRGIVVVSILQSWAQGVTCWGEQGMRKLWDAANVKVFAGGVTDTAFLEGLSQLYGSYDRAVRSRSSSRLQGASTSLSYQRERVFSVDDLAAMPPGRAAVALSGTRPVLVATQPWMTRPDANRVQASLARYGVPDGHATTDLSASGQVAS